MLPLGTLFVFAKVLAGGWAAIYDIDDAAMTLPSTWCPRGRAEDWFGRGCTRWATL